MNIDEMTPEELRAYAMEKEQARAAVEARYMDKPMPATRERARWEREVEFEGRTYTVDMRRLRSRDFLKRIVRAQDEELSTAAQMELFDFVFDGEAGQQVENAVIETVGYADYVEVLRIEAGIFAAVEGKN